MLVSGFSRHQFPSFHKKFTNASIRTSTIQNGYGLKFQHSEAPQLQEYEKTLLGAPEKDRGIYEANLSSEIYATGTRRRLVLQGWRDLEYPMIPNGWLDP
jgi:hypothetical protein